MTDTDLKWPVVQKARPTTIKPHTIRHTSNKEWKTAVVLPDPQIGFRLYEDGTLDPFHSVEAIDVALQILAYVQEKRGVDKVVNLGDFLDLANMGRFAQEPTFANTVQPAIDAGHIFLARQRATAPDAEIVVVEGNHDKRMSAFIQNNAAASMGIRRANIPQSWPVMSLPYLLRLDELDVEYVDAWPTGQYWINNRLRAIHGNKVRSDGSTANAYVKHAPHISTIFGHVHRIELHYRTTFDHDGPLRNVAATPGCLCRIDGAVPSANGAVHLDGTPGTYYEDWQQGVMIVNYTLDGRFSLEPVQIIDGWAFWDSREFRTAA